MKMNKKAIAASATSIAVIGGLLFASPSFAAPSTPRSLQTGLAANSQASHNHVLLPATLAGIPSTVTKLQEAVRGAYFTAYSLNSAVLPATQPSTGGRKIAIKPTRAADGTISIPTITNGAVNADLGLRAPTEAGTSYFALYPSDGTAAVLVTLTVDADGKASVTASRPLTVTYSADVAAAKTGIGHHGKRGQEGKGQRGMRGGHLGISKTSPNV